MWSKLTTTSTECVACKKMIKGDSIDGESAFNLFQTYGYPIEMTIEIAEEREIRLTDKFQEEYDKAMKKHQELSRTAAAGKFKGGLADHSEETTKLHTAAHLLLESAKDVIKNDKMMIVTLSSNHQNK